MLEQISDGQLGALIGLLAGIALGLAARMGRFCTMGAIEDKLYGENDTRFRMWGVVLGTALIGTFTLSALGLFDMSEAIYYQAPFSPVASILGGLIFGYGMALAGNCGFGALAQLGGGDMRYFVVVMVLGVTSMAVLSGPFAQYRLDLIAATTMDTGTIGYPQLLSDATGIPPSAFGIALGLVFLAITLANADFRSARTEIFWSVIVGLAVTFAWGGTYYVFTNGFDEIQVEAMTYAAPVGEALIYTMTASAGGINFGVGSVTGVVVGAFIGSMMKGHFRWEACEDPRELRRQIIGGGLMGVGAAFALGCSIGQGLSAMSVLSFGAPLALVSILIGAAIGLRQIMFGMTWWR